MEIITKDAARERGLQRYFTGKPCKHGHVSERYVSTCICVECGKQHSRAGAGKDLETKRAKYAAKPKSEEFIARGRQRAKEWREKNLERARLAGRLYQRENRETRLAYHREWRAMNREDQRAKYNARREMWRENPMFQIKERVGQLIRASLRDKGFSKNSRTAQILGCTYEEFFAHLERQFLRGMTWENRALWHIDHIVPLATAKTEAEVLALNHFTNLRPLWIPDNLKKGAKQTHLL